MGVTALRACHEQELDWRGCGRRLQCATATVPLDYADPVGPTIELALTRIPGRPGATRTLFINPGGPGESGVAEVRSSFGRILARDLGGRHDIVGFDPRGVGASTPIECLDDAFGRGCEQRSGAGAIRRRRANVAFWAPPRPESPPGSRSCPGAAPTLSVGRRTCTIG